MPPNLHAYAYNTPKYIQKMHMRAGWCMQTIILSDKIISQERLQERCKPWISLEGEFLNCLHKKGAIHNNVMHI